MKKILFTTILLLACLSTFAQSAVKVTVVIPAPYKDYLSYYREEGRMVITIQNLTNTRQEVYLRGVVEGGNDHKKISTKSNYRPARGIVIPAGIGQMIQVSSQEIQELYKPENLDYYSTSSEQIRGADRVGPGMYTICVQAYDYRQHTRPLSAAESGCTTIFMQNIEAPMLIQPLVNAEIKSIGTQNVIFSWTRPAGSPMGLTYNLKIVEMFDPKRDPNDAYLAATAPAFFEREVMNNVYVYGPADPPLVEGRKYAWAITAIDPAVTRRRGRPQASVFQNDGRSEIRSFIYKKEEVAVPVTPPVQPRAVPQPIVAQNQTQAPPTPNPIAPAPPASTAVVCGCSQDIFNGPASTVVNGDQIKVNTFTMKVTSAQDDGGGKFSGTGTIPLPIVNSAVAQLRVKFKDLAVVSDAGGKRMIAGEVKGITRADMSLLPNADTPGFEAAPLSSNDIHNIGNYFNQQKGQLVSNLKNAANSAGFELPIGIDQGPLTIGVTQVFFNAKQAWFNAVASMDIPDGNAKAAFEMTGACMRATDLCGDFKLRLKEDLVLASIGMNLKRNAAQNEGTYILFDKQGFKELSLDLDYLFQGGLKNANTKQNLTANMTAKTSKGWSDWVASVTMPDFYVDGMQSIVFSLGNRKISYDHSDLQNPAGMPSSIKVGDETYTAISTKTWHGFYIPEITVKLPEMIKNTTTNSGISLSGRQIIIDNNGFTGAITNTTPVLELNKGSLDGWYASIDRISLNFLRSGFKESKMTGKLVLPPSKDSSAVQNQLDYSSTLTAGSGSGLAYNFTIKPKSNLKFDALFAVATINDNSQIRVSAGGGNALLAKTELHGSLSIKNVTGLASVDMPGISFRNLKFQTTAPFWDKDGFHFELASPQKKLAGFNFTMKTPELRITPQGSTKAAVGLLFGGSIGLIETSWTCEAATGFLLNANFEKIGNRITFTGIGGSIENIDFGAGVDLGPLKIAGKLKYYNTTVNGKKDEGFIGALHTQIASMLGVTMRAQFGTYSQSNKSFKYFDFGAMVDFGQAGITFAPPVPLALYGFGGGFSYNMKPENNSLPAAESVPTKVNQTSNTEPMSLETPYQSEGASNTDHPLDQLLKHPAGIKLVPAEGYFGLNATILLGLTSRNVLDADVTLNMSFTNSGGVHSINLKGNARVLTDISKPLASRNASSTGTGTITLDYNFEEKSFLARIETTLGVPTSGNAKFIKAESNIEFAADPGGWHFYAGRPFARDKVSLLRRDILGGSSNSYFFTGGSYFQVGSRVDDMPPPPDKVYEYAGVQKQSASTVGVPNPVANRGVYSPNKGLIVGANTEFDTGKIKFLMFYGQLAAIKGFDISIRDGVTCRGMSNAGGPGGWYATGGAYFGAKGSIGISVNLLLVKGDIEIFSGGIGALIQAGLPNPTWIEGIVGGQFSVLDGLIDGRFHLKVAIGTRCQTTSDALGGLDIISEVLPASQTDPPLSILTTPSITFNIPVGKTFVFEDFVNTTDKGEPRKRYFQFDNSCIDIFMKEGDSNEKKISLSSMFGNYDRTNYKLDINKVYNRSHLKTRTKYTFRVEARMKEKEKGSYRWVDKNAGTTTERNKAASQSESVTFGTDNGFKQIRSQEYWETAPLHSHKVFPYSEDTPMFIKLKKIIDLKDYLADVTVSTVYAIRVFKDGIKDKDYPVRITQENSQFNTHTLLSFPKVSLLPSANYVFALIAKNEAQTQAGTVSRVQADGTLSRLSTASLSGDLKTTFDGVKIYKNVLSGGVNTLGAGENMVGGFSFKTSKYPTYASKATNFIINKITLANGETIFGANTTIKNRQNFEKYIKKDSVGNYVIIYGDTNFPSEGDFSIDETFSFADELLSYSSTFTTDDLFSTTGDSFNPKRRITAVDNLQHIPIFRYLTEQIVPFISKHTGIPNSNIKTIFSSHVTEMKSNARDKGASCQEHGGLSAGRNRETDTKLGAKLPENLPDRPSSGGGSSAGSNTSGVGGTFNGYSSLLSEINLPQSNLTYLNQFISQKRLASYTNTTLLANCKFRGAIMVTNVVQAMVNKLINPRVNPDPSQRLKFNQVGSWQSVNAIGNSLKNGAVNPLQAGQQFGNTFR